jgi:hypothetical protein
VLELVDCQETDVDAEASDLLQKGLALFVSADAENGGLLLLISHAGSCSVCWIQQNGVTVIKGIKTDKRGYG